MDNLIFATIGRYLALGLILFLLSACANKDVARKAYQDGDYKKALAIWERWADAGYGNADLKLAQLAQKEKVQKSNKYIIQHAQKAYANGEKKAALILESIYTKNQEYDKAVSWMKKADFKLSSNSDINRHLFLITNSLQDFKEQSYYLKKIANLAQNGNVSAAYKLGKFYQNKNTPFHNIDKSLHFYNIAYKAGDIRAGIEIALIDIAVLNKKEEGIALLKKIGETGDAKAALLIGKYIYRDMNTLLEKYNRPCIACSFETPLDFYVKKLTLQELEHLYLQKNVVPWFKKAYKAGNLDGMFELIRLDITENNYAQAERKNYSGMDLDQTINYLDGLSTQFFKAKMILARIYEKYPHLHRKDLAEQTYMEYMDQNATDAQWHLYQFYKRFYPDSQKKDFYLKNLIVQDFEPAEIENAYSNILKNRELQKSYHLLKYEATKENLKALQYLSGLYLKENTPQKRAEFCQLAKHVCRLQPLNQKNDLKIARYYIVADQDANLTKAATIYQFYADQNNTAAQYALASIYKDFCDFNKSAKLLKRATDLGNREALFAYDTMILEGKTDGNVSTALETVQEYAEANHREALLILADLYAKGAVVDFDPDKAIQYYQKALQLKEDPKISLKMINLYTQININHQYDQHIIDLYNDLIYTQKLEKLKINLGKFLITQKRYDEAEKLLKSLPYKHYPEAKYLLYTITGKMYYMQDGFQTNNGNLLLVYAKYLMDNASRRKALLYAFRASLCNTNGSGQVIYNLMRYINDSQTIKDIFQEAKASEKCSNAKL